MKKIERLIEEAGVIINDDHFVYTTGKHGSGYVNKDELSLHPGLIAAVAEDMQVGVEEAGEIEVVLAPPMGAIMIGYQLSCLLGVPAVYAEKTAEGGMVIKRGFDKFLKGKKVLVAEDVTTTGSSVKKLLATLEKQGIECEVVGVSVLYNRGGVTAEDLGVPFMYAAVDKAMAVYEEGECPLCKAGVEVNTRLGHGKEFLARKE